MIRVVVPGTPVAKGRARVGRGGNVYTPKGTRIYEATARQYAMIAMVGKQRIEGPIALGVVVTLPVPPSWPLKKRTAAIAGELHPTGRPDLDNYVKAALDALNTIVWADDSQVTQLTAVKVYGLSPALTITATEVNR